MSKNKSFSKNRTEKRIEKEVLYGRNACLGCISGYQNSTKTREIYNIYIKTIKGGEIKKSVFCCWSLLQEEYEYILENQKDTIDEKIINKVLIKDKSNQKYRKKVSLKTEGDIGLNFEVNFIELEDFLKIIKLRFKEELKNINKKEILLIMVTKKELN